MSGMGSGSYFAQEGVFEFGTKEWGPQALQLVLSTVDCNAASLGVAKDTGVTEIKQLKGKRGRLRGRLAGAEPERRSRSLCCADPQTKRRQGTSSSRSYGAMWKGMVNNDVDAAFATTITGPAKELETSPRGIVWPPLPPGDKAGWERVKKVGSFFFPHVATCGAGITKDKPVELGNYPYPIFVSYGSLAADEVYAITKAMITGYDAYKGFLRAGRGRPCGRPPDQELGGPGASGRREGAEGSRALVRRAGDP